MSKGKDGGYSFPLRKVHRRKRQRRIDPRHAKHWVYWSENSKSTAPKGPVAVSVLLELIRSRRLSEEVLVAPAVGPYSGVPAATWQYLAQRMPLNLAELCRVWVRGSARRRWPDRDWWAWEKATREVESSPARGWRVISALVAAAPSESVLGNIGALYVEDFIQMYPAWHGRVVARARRDRKFRRCLGCVRRRHLTRSMIEIAGPGVP